MIRKPFAVAVTTAAFAVGASCPFLRSGVGAVSTQSLTNRYLGPAILDRIGRGFAPAAAIEDALATDAGRHVARCMRPTGTGALRPGPSANALLGAASARASTCRSPAICSPAGGGRCDVRCHGSMPW